MDGRGKKPKNFSLTGQKTQKFPLTGEKTQKFSVSLNKYFIFENSHVFPHFG
jgi:hypothetical protein